MEDLERNFAIAATTDRPRLWLRRFVDEGWADWHSRSRYREAAFDGKQLWTTSTSKIPQFTVVEVEKDWKLPFLDAEIERQGAHLSMTVYRGRKTTPSRRYLNFESHHPVTAKCSTVDALFSRAEAIVTNEEQKQAEFSKIKQELLATNYPASAHFIDNRLDRIKQRKTEESVRSRET